MIVKPLAKINKKSRPRNGGRPWNEAAFGTKNFSMALPLAAYAVNRIRTGPPYLSVAFLLRFLYMHRHFTSHNGRAFVATGLQGAPSRA